MPVNAPETKTVSFNYSGPGKERLDKVLVDRFPEQSRSRLQAWIEEGLVLVNGNVPGKTGIKLETGDLVQVTIPPIRESKITPEDIQLEIIFENRDLMLVNKPAGMVVHPAAGHSSGTLVHAALAHAPEMEGVGGEHRPGVVHRLDKGTSGLILLAKNDYAHRWLQEQFSKRKVNKFYLTLVDGHPPTPTGRIDAPIGRDPNHRKKMAITAPGKGRKALSEYLLLESFPHHSLLQVQIFTGRTHQIRLHTRFIGCPVVGDTVYGHHHPSLAISRPFLHAARLEIILPGESEPRCFTAPLPVDLEQVLDELRR
ncbi:MAG: RluA family pseudouridine synthase [Anaerolineae bacterium]|nr:RluA family pseudouridine synthase [Anaerolineae bacterium]